MAELYNIIMLYYIETEYFNPDKVENVQYNCLLNLQIIHKFILFINYINITYLL